MAENTEGVRTVLSIDLETYSSVDLGKCGVYKYCESDDFEILLFAYAFDDEEVRIIDMACGEELPQEIIDAIESPDIIKAAWNAQFERTCLSRYLGHQLSPDSWHCSMVHAASLSLPLSLKEAAKALKTGEQKDRSGEALIRKFSVPKVNKTTGAVKRTCPKDDPEGWQMFKDYCLQDVRTERDIRKKIERFPMPDIEWDFYHMDQRINDRGVLIDMELVEQAITCDLTLSDEMAKRAYELTGLENPNSVSQLKMWLEERGIDAPSLGKKEVAALIAELDKNSVDQEALDMLKLRLQMAKSSVKKYQAAERAACKDGRARGLFQFNGANRTGRWSGRLIQLQNLPQNHIETLDEARELVKMGCFELLSMFYGNTPDILSQLIRTMLIPKPGCEFRIADYSAVEARVLAWEAGEQWRLDAFRDGKDIYCESASQMFHVPVVKHGINGDLRQKGKVAELACIARDSLVRTDKGEIPIQHVTRQHRVWDGFCWVEHDGVVLKGMRPIIHYDGLSATADHLVFVENRCRPVPFGEAAKKKMRLRRRNRRGYTEDVYYGYARTYDILNAGPMHRFTVSGCLVHNCGYQGGAGALISMGALDMGLKESELQGLIDDWREANPAIVKYWYDVERAATETVKTHKDTEVGKILFEFYGNALWTVLPSGRKLAYLSPKLQPNRFGRMSLTFMGVGANNKWSRQETYGGKLVENCIAEGTLVMTDRGLVPIEGVLADDLIWDGEEWVHHEGLIDKGMQETVSVDGIHMTADHKILTEEGWCECGKAHGFNWAEVRQPVGNCEGGERQVGCDPVEMQMRLRNRNHGAEGGFDQKEASKDILWVPEEEPTDRPDGTEVQLSDGARTGREYKTGKDAMAVPMRVRKTGDCSSIGFDEEEISDKVVRVHERRVDFCGKNNSWDEPSSGMGSVALDEAEVRRSQSPGVPQLRWQGDNSLPGVERQLRGILEGHGAILPAWTGYRPDRQQSGIQTGELPVDNPKGQLQEQTDKPCSGQPVWENAGVSPCGTDRNQGDDIALPAGTRMAGGISVCSAGLSERVYDIRNCGPRHRFSVCEPGTGKLRIVSNCTQAIARDLLAEAMLRIEKAGYDIVGSVHDEVIVEAPVGVGSVEELCSLMSESPKWCPDLLLNAAGYSGQYYFKD